MVFNTKNTIMYTLSICFFLSLLITPTPSKAIDITTETGDLVITQENFVFTLEKNYTRFHVVFFLENQGVTSINEFTVLLDFEGTQFQAYANNTALPLHAIIQQETSSLSLSLIHSLQPGEHLELVIQGITTTLQESLDANTFLFLYLHKTPYPILVNMRIELPVSAILSDVSKSNEIVLFPLAPRNYTDGTRLIFEWNNLIVSGNQAYFIKYTLTSNSPPQTHDSSFSWPFILGFLTGSFLILLLFSLALFLLIRKNMLKPSSSIKFPLLRKILPQTTITKHVKPVHLSIPEHKIIKVLRENKGSMLQNDLVDQVQFSKSAVSQYISKLQKKGVLKKEVMGRTNRIILIADPIDSSEKTNETNST